MNPNLKYIEKLADGSEAFKNKLIGILKNEFPIEKKIFIEAYKNDQFNEAAELVHKIKHKLGMFNMEKAYEFSITFESDLKKGKISGFPEFMSILEKVETFIKKL